MHDPQERLDEISLRPTIMDVNLDALSHNFAVIKSFVAPAKIMGIVKANAYGHGLVTCARHLESLGVDFLGLAFVEEGIALRKAGVKLPILVLGGILGNQIKLFLKYDLDITASSVAKLSSIEQAAIALGKRARVHLKIDTGMERIGVHYYTANTLLEESLRCKHCDIVGVFSHFATAKEGNLEYTKLQLERFLECLRFFEARSVEMPLRHIANSAGFLELKSSILDMVRPGITLYGVGPTPGNHLPFELKPTMSLSSRVVYFKVVKKGAGVSYGHSWHAAEDTRVVTVPVGYGDGYFRRLSNRGQVLIRGQRHSVVGAVCMDQMMVNIGPQGTAYNDDEVMLVGAQGEERITVEEIAKLVETTPHEVLVSTNMRVPRRYQLQGRIWAE